MHTCVCVRMFISNEINRVRNLQYTNSIFVYCLFTALFAKPHWVCLCTVYHIPTILHFSEIVCGTLYSVFAVNAVNAISHLHVKSDYCSYSWLDVIGQPTKWIYMHQMDSPSHILMSRVQHVGHTMSSLSCYERKWCQ